MGGWLSRAHLDSGSPVCDLTTVGGLTKVCGPNGSSDGAFGSNTPAEPGLAFGSVDSVGVGAVPEAGAEADVDGLGERERAFAGAGSGLHLPGGGANAAEAGDVGDKVGLRTVSAAEDVAAFGGHESCAFGRVAGAVNVHSPYGGDKGGSVQLQCSGYVNGNALRNSTN